MAEAVEPALVGQAGGVRMRRTMAVALVAALVLVSCGSDDEPAADDGSTTTAAARSTTPGSAPSGDDAISAALATDHTYVVARAAVDEIPVFADPEDTSEVQMTLPRFDPDYTGTDGEQVEQVFLAEDYEDQWLHVLLPVRPNGTTGWIRLGDVEMSKHRYDITVDVGDHELTLREAGEVVQRSPIAVGTQDTPTPGGRFYLNALIQPPDPDTVYGTYAYALSGYSDTLTQFAGGDGVIGIHGTNDPSVLGSDVSHGCIRMRNEDIESLVEMLPLGTPVEIVA
ncbi:MAG: L,D-transpeptidase [Acidimicrobiales bacterium]|nr:L,D-transpeptidase [Acidimicrobiales bacterium]